MLTRETEVTALDHAAEEQLVEQLRHTRYARILMVSDLHLCTGRDRDTGVFQMTENFYADDAFQSLLRHYGGNSSLLVLNGDTFDFIRITDYPQLPIDFTRWEVRLSELRDPRAASLPRTISRVERTYGLKTNDYKTLWKLMRIVDGHAQFFDALAEWVAAGGAVLFVKGNHDVELHWPLIRHALRDELSERGAAPDDVMGRVGFVDRAVEIGNVYVAHGHQYEDMTRVDGEAVLAGATEQINLPLGSFINRYGINKIEQLDPFIDNIKPVQQALLALLRRHPVAIIGTYVRAWRLVSRALRKRRFNRAVFFISLGLALPFLVPLLLFVVPGAWERLQNLLPFGPTGDRIAGGLSGVISTALLPYLLGAITEMLRRFKKPRDHLAEGAARSVGGMVRNYQHHYAVMGHTHVQVVKRLKVAGYDALYLNTGTWIALWPQDRRDLIGQVRYTYVEFAWSNGEYRHNIQEWDEHANRPRSARILVAATAS